VSPLSLYPRLAVPRAIVRPCVPPLSYPLPFPQESVTAAHRSKIKMKPPLYPLARLLLDFGPTGRVSPPFTPRIGRKSFSREVGRGLSYLQ